MTDTRTNLETGLPELPEGQYWHVRAAGSHVDGAPKLRVEARKRLPRKTHMVETGRTAYWSVLEALRSRQYRGRMFVGAYDLDCTYLPDLWADDVELVNKNVEEIKHFKPKRWFRKPELDYIEYRYEADVLWDDHEVLFYGDTTDLSESGIARTAFAALKRHQRSLERDEFVESVSGDYPPKKLEAK